MQITSLLSFCLASLSIVVASPVPAPNLVGNQLGVIGLASQNSAVNNGNTGGSVSHSANVQNTAQQIVTDAQSIGILKNINIAEMALKLPKGRHLRPSENYSSSPLHTKQVQFSWSWGAIPQATPNILSNDAYHSFAFFLPYLAQSCRRRSRITYCKIIGDNLRVVEIISQNPIGLGNGNIRESSSNSAATSKQRVGPHVQHSILDVSVLKVHWRAISIVSLFWAESIEELEKLLLKFVEPMRAYSEAYRDEELKGV
ncbi:hypothetical protein BKA70DRAFT_1222940 [Coprinopsis sp. MPI-PUGE-AT-0042]|nr:hypothetical protein BKA70DRAFT_1222940 [Coprinopsis sp. MPI-PUGE-AT-0042]